MSEGSGIRGKKRKSETTKDKKESSSKNDTDTTQSASVSKTNKTSPTTSASTQAASTTAPEQFEFFYTKQSPFSQFYPVKFTVDGTEYSCAEQYMMHSKAVEFKDDKIADQIMKETKPLNMKRLGRKVSNFDVQVWCRKSKEIVKKGNICKFSQNEDIKKKLFATYPKTMAEASPRDCLWGIGLGHANPKAQNRATWRGKNLLGFILTEVRNDLMKTENLIPIKLSQE